MNDEAHVLPPGWYQDPSVPGGTGSGTGRRGTRRSQPRRPRRNTQQPHRPHNKSDINVQVRPVPIKYAILGPQICFRGEIREMMRGMQDKPAGWYQVPGRPRLHRYWNGSGWIEPAGEAYEPEPVTLPAQAALEPALEPALAPV